MSLTEENCSVTFSLRITPAQKIKIEQYARIAGIKPSSWVKDAIDFAVENMGVSDRKISKETILTLVRSDPEIRKELAVAVDSLFNLREVRKLMNENCEPKTIAEALTDYDLSKGFVRYTEGILAVSLTWDSTPMPLETYQKMTRTNNDFFLLEDKSGECIIFWNGLENPELDKIIEGFEENTCSIRHASISRLEGIVNLNDRISNQIVAMIREVCWQKTGNSPGPRVAFRDKFCRQMIVETGGVSGLPSSFTLDWQSENLREGKYPSVDDLIRAVQYEEDETLRPIYKVDWP